MKSRIMLSHNVCKLHPKAKRFCCANGWAARLIQLTLDESFELFIF